MSGTVLQGFRDELAEYKTSKGTIRFTPDRPLPSALVKRIVGARIAENHARLVQRRTQSIHYVHSVHLVHHSFVGPCNEERNGFREFELRATVQRHELHSVEMEGGGHRAYVFNFRVLEDGRVKLRHFSGFAVEPKNGVICCI
jgi:hypothetical protein